MFKKGPKEMFDLSNDSVETIVGPSVKIEGDFKSGGNVIVAGHISGKFSSGASLRVEERAKIIADIQAKDAVIAGEINGNINIEGHLEILATAKITGDIQTGSLAIQQGAIINGSCSMTHAKSGAKIEAPSKEQVAHEWLLGGGDEKVNFKNKETFVK